MFEKLANIMGLESIPYSSDAFTAIIQEYTHQIFNRIQKKDQRVLEFFSTGTCQLRAGLLSTQVKLAEIVLLWMTCGVELGTDAVVKVKEFETDK